MIIIKGVVALCLVVLFLGLVSAAFGVASPCDAADCYWIGRPLVLEPGESREVSFVLQSAEEEDVNLGVELTSGSEVAALTDGVLEYTVSSGRQDVRVGMLIEVPGDAEPGTEFVVGILVKQAPSGEGEMVQFATSVGKSFPVRVGGEVTDDLGESNILGWILLGGIVLLVVIIIVFVVKKKKEKIPALGSGSDSIEA